MDRQGRVLEPEARDHEQVQLGQHIVDAVVRKRAHQQGSAYVITLLALVVLTILALSLTLVTQSEMQIGTNERIIQRIFYAADSGIAATTARALVTNDFSERTIVIRHTLKGALEKRDEPVTTE